MIIRAELKRELVDKKINKNNKKVLEKWKVLNVKSLIKEYRRKDIVDKFINYYGSLEEAKLVSMVSEIGRLYRYVFITIEPDLYGELKLCVRYLISTKRENVLRNNKVGTEILGYFNLDDLEGLWNLLNNILEKDVDIL